MTTLRLLRFIALNRPLSPCANGPIAR
jgi:hypothetical protein